MNDQKDTIQEAINDALVGSCTDFYVYRKDDAYAIVRGYRVCDQFLYDYVDENILDRLIQDKCPGFTFVEKVECSEIRKLLSVMPSDPTVFQYVGPGSEGNDFVSWHLESLGDYYVFTEAPSDDEPGRRNFLIVTTKREKFLGEKFFRELRKLYPSEQEIEFQGCWRDQNPSTVEEELAAHVGYFGCLLKTGGRYFEWDGETFIQRSNVKGGEM
jgi:hypothetical protein